MERFRNLPDKNDEFLIITICLTNIKERYENYVKQKKNISSLALFDAITPFDKVFKEKNKQINFLPYIKDGTRALWLSDILIFQYFMNSNHKCLIVVEDDASLPINMIDIIKEHHIKHNDFIKYGGTRLGQYASCNLYNKFCVNNILKTIVKYPIDRGIDHYISNICSENKQILPYLFNTTLSGIPLLTSMNQDLSNRSVRIYYDNKLIN
jgi:hypothetical protein